MKRETIVFEYVEIDQRANALLKHWGRWSRERTRQGRCRSIEHRYLPERGELEAKPAALPYSDYPAVYVEEVLVHPAFPDLWRVLLVGAYSLRCPDDGLPALVRKRIGRGINRANVADELRAARRAVFNLLSPLAIR